MRTKKNKKKVNVNEVMTFCTISKVDGREQIKIYRSSFNNIIYRSKKKMNYYSFTLHTLFIVVVQVNMTSIHV